MLYCGFYCVADVYQAIVPHSVSGLSISECLYTLYLLFCKYYMYCIWLLYKGNLNLTFYIVVFLSINLF